MTERVFLMVQTLPLTIEIHQLLLKDGRCPFCAGRAGLQHPCRGAEAVSLGVVQQTIEFPQLLVDKMSMSLMCRSCGSTGRQHSCRHAEADPHGPGDHGGGR